MSGTGRASTEGSTADAGGPTGTSSTSRTSATGARSADTSSTSTPAAGKPRGNYAKTAARRQDILQAGIDVFAEHGFRSGSIREIAARVGMSQAGLLHHFANKNELLAAVLAFRDERDRVNAGVELDAGIETIRGLVRLVEYNARVPGLVELHCVLSAEATSVEHPAHEHFVQRYEWMFSGISNAFRAMRDAGQLADGVDPDGSARAVIALMDGLQLQWLLRRDALDMAAETRRYLRPLLTVEL